MQNDRGVFWYIALEGRHVKEFDNAEAARKAATDMMTASPDQVIELFKFDPVKGSIRIQV